MNWYDELYYCIRSALLAGITPEEFRRRTLYAWHEILDEDKEHATKVLTERGPGNATP